jgi:uncharacterized protein YndB with AHSA1/START domain
MDAKRKNDTATKNQTTVERKSDRELLITRMFNGPARIVFDAWTKAELVARWWAPKSRGVSVVSCNADVRVGGRWRYVLRHSGTEEIAFSGEYLEVKPHTRLAYTSIFEAFPDSPSTVAVTFEERDGKTLLVAHETYSSKEALDAAIATGMEGGMRETMDQLDELVASLL